MLGIPFTTRMTLVRLADGALWLHSPVALTRERRASVSALGPVGHVVAPNKFHHLFVREWLAAFPEAVGWAEPASDSLAMRWVKRWNGIAAPDGGCPRDWRFTVRHRDAARAALRRVLAWDVERVVLAHGRCVERDGRAFLERAFAWLAD